MRFRIIGCVFFIFLFISFQAYSQAQIVHDPEQTAVLTEQVMVNLKNQLTQLQNAIKSLTSFNWNSSEAYSQLQNLTGYLQQSGNLASNASSVDKEFQQYFTGYKPSTGSDYNAQYSHIIEDANTALKSVMQVMASINNQSDPMNQHQKLEQIQMQINGAQGQVQATQGLAQITAQLASNMEVLQKTVAAQASAQDAYYAAQLQNQASEAAAFQKMMDAGSKKAPPIGTTGEDIDIKG